jgi:hypothetical protein
MSLAHSSVKRIAGSALLALLLLGMSGTPARAQLGVAAGLNFESLDDIETTTDADQNATVENATGYHIGLVYDLGAGPVKFRPGLFYRNVGTYDFPEVGEVDVTAFEVPVDVRVSLLPASPVGPYLLGGPKAFLPQSENDAFGDGLEDVSFVFDVGVGADVSLPGAGLTLQPELRYEFGATDYVDESFEIGDTTFNPSERKLSAFALRLNVVL